jgi:hypothetical protein
MVRGTWYHFSPETNNIPVIRRINKKVRSQEMNSMWHVNPLTAVKGITLASVKPLSTVTPKNTSKPAAPKNAMAYNHPMHRDIHVDSALDPSYSKLSYTDNPGDADFPVS